jgi:hypothetical protein
MPKFGADMVYWTEPTLSYALTKKVADCEEFWGILTVTEGDEAPLAGVHCAVIPCGGQANWSLVLSRLCSVTETAFEAFPLIETFVLTCRFLPTTKPLGAIRPLSWTLALSVPPTTGAVNPAGCVSITEVAPVLEPLAVKFTVALLVPPLNETKAGETAPMLGIELAMGTLTVELDITGSASTNRPVESSRAANTVRLVCTPWKVLKAPPIPFGPETTNPELAYVIVAVLVP